MEDTILKILVDLDMFSRLGPNLYIHLDRNGHFIVTSKNWAPFCGVQTLTNICKSHTTQKLINDLHNFFGLMINILNMELEKINNNDDDKLKSIKNISVICREFKLAYVGLPNVIDGGLIGILETYKNDNLILQLKNVISYAYESINEIKKRLNIITQNTNLECPEKTFTNDDWENAMRIVPSLQSEYVNMYKYYINYSSILTLNIFDKYNWWDEIICFDNNVKIYLGALPIVSNLDTNLKRNDLKSLKDIGVDAVLSVVEVFENNSDGYIYEPVKPNDWKNASFKHYQIPSSDFCTMHIETLEKGVEFMHWNIKNGRTIYVHCKSGKSRSFLIVVSYLVKYLGYKAHDAIKYVKGKRVQAGFGKNSTKMEVLERFEKLCMI